MKDNKQLTIKKLDTIGFEIQNHCDEIGYDIDNNSYYTEFNSLITQFQFAEPNSIEEKYLDRKLVSGLKYLLKDLSMKKIYAV